MVVGGGLVGTYLILRPHDDTFAYEAHYLGTGVTHYLFDGWIWRRPHAERAPVAATDSDILVRA